MCDFEHKKSGRKYQLRWRVKNFLGCQGHVLSSFVLADWLNCKIVPLISLFLRGFPPYYVLKRSLHGHFKPPLNTSIKVVSEVILNSKYCSCWLDLVVAWNVCVKSISTHSAPSPDVQGDRYSSPMLPLVPFYEPNFSCRNKSYYCKRNLVVKTWRELRANFFFQHENELSYMFWIGLENDEATIFFRYCLESRSQFSHSKYRHSSISAVSISMIFDLTRFIILSYFPPL